MSEILKIEAAGNDFIFLAREHGVPTAGRIQALCDRHFGIGADGLVVMENIDATHSRWSFFNSDGSHAAMCGNAARAAAAWLKHEGKSFPHHLETDFGDVILNEHVVTTPPGFTARVSYAKRELAIAKIATDFSHDTTGTIAAAANLIDTGVPHAVIELRDSVLKFAQERKETLTSIASKLRWAKEAGTGGANVTFFSRTGSSIESVTFERGVEDLTLSCGTGVLAAAVVSSGLDLQKRGENLWPLAGFEVRAPGATLWVQSEDFPRSLTLVGPANIVFSLNLISSR